MKLIYASVGIFLLGYLMVHLISCKNRSSTSSPTEMNEKKDTSRIKETKVQQNMYPEFRKKSLTITPNELHLNLDNNKTTVYGVVMDWDIGSAIATIVSFQTGDASLYLSAGQIYIGGYAHENVKNAGLALVREAQNYLLKAKLSNDVSLPDKGCVKFHLLTNKGKFTFQETVENVTNKNSEWTRLFDLGNNIITEYRTTTDK